MLKTLKHQESHLIVKIYTRDFGVRDFMLKGYGSAQSRSKYSYFQPLSIVELVFWEKPGTEIHKINESRALFFPHDLQFDPVKLSLGLTAMEIVTVCIRKDGADSELYELISTLLMEIDTANERIIQLFIYFMVHFIGKLGFAPQVTVTNPQLPMTFDIQNSTILNAEGGNTRLCALLIQFLNADIQACRHISFTQEEKRHLISTLFHYYFIHIEGFKYPKSLQVFAEVFE